MKRVRFDLVGNDGVKEYLSQSVQNGKTAHAYIVEGRAGSGRKTLVKQLLQALSCEEENVPCGKCGNCLKIGSGFCVDIYTVKVPEGKSEITVDIVRDMISGMMISPNDLDFKAYIIEEADKMNNNAQNALLKVLEEPPADIYFFLITENASKLLPTVRSRALILRTAPLTEAQMLTVLKNNGIPDNAKAKDAVKAARGSAGEAISIYRGDNEISKNRAVCDGLISILCSGIGSKSEFTGAHHRHFKKPEDMAAVYDLLLGAVRDCAVIRKSPRSELSYFRTEDDAEIMMAAISDKAALQMSEVISEYLYMYEVPTNHAMTMTEFSSRLWDAHLL